MSLPNPDWMTEDEAADYCRCSKWAPFREDCGLPPPRPIRIMPGSLAG